MGSVLVPERPPASGPTTAPMPRPEFVVEHTSEELPAPQLEVTPRTGDIETYDGTLDFDAVAHDAAKADGLEVQEEVALKPQQLEVEGLAATQYESGTFAARAAVKMRHVASTTGSQPRKCHHSGRSRGGSLAAPAGGGRCLGCHLRWTASGAGRRP